MFYEAERIELKEVRTDDLYKEVNGFTNTDGGTILLNQSVVVTNENM